MAFIFSQGDMTQGDALAMAAYEMGLLPLICKLKRRSSQWSSNIGSMWVMLVLGATFGAYENYFGGFRK
jgi:hypothetical protein